MGWDQFFDEMLIAIFQVFTFMFRLIWKLIQAYLNRQKEGAG
jgi:hypothetical protein